MRRDRPLISSTLLALVVLTSIVRWAVSDAAAQTDQPPAILISRQLAIAEGLQVDDTVALATQTRRQCCQPVPRCRHL